MADYAGLFKTASDIVVTIVQEYQGPTVALVLSGVVVMTLMYLDKHYGDNVEAAEAASAAGSPRRAAKAVAKADSAADQADLPRLKTENLSAAVEEAQLSPRARKTASRRKSAGKEALGSYWDSPAKSEVRSRRRSQIDN